VKDVEYLLRAVHRVLNRLIEVYRVTMGEFYLEPVPFNELWRYEVGTIEDSGVLSRDVSVVQSYGYGITLARTARIPEEARHLLSSGDPLPVPRLLYLNAQRENLLENYRVAVIEVETAFEVMIDRIVAGYYRKQGHSESDIEKILDCGLRNVLRDHIPKCCGQQFVSTPEHAAWDTNLYRLRTAVVHDGAPVDGDQAGRALEAAEKALEWLETNSRAAEAVDR
jgi:hypothetical protein